MTDLFTPVPDECGTITPAHTHTHTPGPWRVFDVFTDVEIVTDKPTADATESLVQFRGQRNARANARLMAAAPDLLECLEWLMNEAIPDGNRFQIGFLPEDKRDGYRKCADVLTRVRRPS
jgi:hypothetical protein